MSCKKAIDIVTLKVICTVYQGRKFKGRKFKSLSSLAKTITGTLNHPALLRKGKKS